VKLSPSFFGFEVTRRLPTDPCSLSDLLDVRQLTSLIPGFQNASAGYSLNAVFIASLSFPSLELAPQPSKLLFLVLPYLAEAHFYCRTFVGYLSFVEVAIT